MRNVTKNLKQIYQCATNEELKQGKEWYLNARLICRRISKNYNVPFIKACAIMSALSPFVNWKRNIRDTEGFIKYELGGGKKYMCGTFGPNVAKAYKLLHLKNASVKSIIDLLHGYKTVNFFLNIYSSRYEAVTIDRHMLNVIFDEVGKWKEYNLTPKRYLSIKNEIKKAASELGLKAYQLQAISWIVWKRLGKEGKL
jgi:hypothetical protein